MKQYLKDNYIVTDEPYELLLPDLQKSKKIAQIDSWVLLKKAYLAKKGYKIIKIVSLALE